MFRNLVLVSCLLFGSGALPAVAAPAATTARKPRLKPDAATLKKAVDELLKQGDSALASGDFKSARDYFSDAIQLDAKNVHGHHGLGLAYIGLNEYLKACDIMEKAVEQGAQDRSLLINLAVAQSGCGRSMRGAKFIMNFINAHPNEADDALLNTLKTALEIIPVANRTSEWQRVNSFYEGQIKKLEAKKPGMKRWGLEWEPATTVEEKLKQAQKSQAQLQTLERKIMVLKGPRDQAEAKLEEAKVKQDRGIVPASYVLRYEYDFEYADEPYQEAVAQYEKAMESIPHPTFPSALTTVPIGDLANSNIDPTKPGETILASNTGPTPAETTNITPKPSEDPPSPAPTNGRRPRPVKKPAKPAVASIRVGASKPAAPVQLTKYAAGFLVSPDLVVTTAAAVKDASRIQLEARDGSRYTAELVKSDDAANLALVRVNLNGKQRPALALAAGPATSAQCPAFASASSLFDDDSADVIENVRVMNNGSELIMPRHPRLPGSPLLSAGKVIGVELAERDSPLNKIPAATLDPLKTLCGEATPVTVARDPLDAIFQVIADGK